MLSKTEKNYFLFIALLILGLMSFLTGILLSVKIPALMPFLKAIHIKSLHEWLSYTLTCLVILHLIFHRDWIKAVVKKR
jgi:cytochrome b561